MNTLIYMRIIIFVGIVIFLVGIYKNLVIKVIHIIQNQQSIQDHDRTNRVFSVFKFIIGITKNYQSFNLMRPVLKVGLDLSGFILILGLTIALIHRIIHRKEEKEFTDIKSLVLLFAVVISGLLSSGSRALLSPASADMVNSLVKYTIFGVLRFVPYPLEDIHYWLFLIHITIASAVVAYIPFSKLVHMFAVPIGRMATMSEDSADRKRARVSEGLL